MIRGCLRGVGCLVILGVAAVAAWLYHDRALDWWRDWRAPEPVAVAPSEELADRVVRRMEDFVAGNGPDSLRFDGEALRSLLVHGASAELPPGVSDPRVTIGDSTAVLAGTLVADSLETGSTRRLRAVLGDSAALEIEVVPNLLREGVGQVTVKGLRAGGVPVPSFAIPFVLKQSGLRVPDGYPRSVVFPLDTTVTGMAVRRGELLVWREGAGVGGR